MQKPIGKITDPYFARQWNLQILRVPEAWQYTQGEGAVVGIIDSGCDGSHKDLGWENVVNITASDSSARVRQKYAPVQTAIDAGKHPKILPGWNFITGNSETWDWQRHGTYMAGCVAAESDGFGMVGVAPQAKIRPYVVLDKHGRGNQAILAQAIRKAAQDGCDVISMSLGYNTVLRAIQEAIEEVIGKHNVIILAATGNSNAKRLMYPALYDGMIAIGGCGPTGERWVHNKYRGSNYGDGLMCVGPAAAQITTKRMRSRFTKADATSMACANIAGVAALAKSLDKDLTQEGFTALLSTWASNRLWDEETGWGVPNTVNIAKALAGLGKPTLKKLQLKLYDLSYEIYAIGDKIEQIQKS